MKKFFFLLGLFSLTCTGLRAQDQITVEWIYDQERIDQFSIPDYQWLDDGSVIMLNKREVPDQRSFKKYDPHSGRMEVFSDMQKAVRSLVNLTGDDSVKVLDWPLEIDSKGRYAVYNFKQDLFLLEFASALFKKITHSTEYEKAARFSPDGRYLSYVFKNNLYIYDIDNSTTSQLTTDGSDTILNGTLSWVYWEEIFGRKDIAYWWSSHSKNIAFLRTDETGVGVMHFVDFKPALKY